MTRRIAALIAGLFIAVAALAGCSHSTPVSYAPAAYGQQVGSAFDCYYLDDPQEAINLVAAGLCPSSSVPTLMPVAWHETYWSYYSSPAYVTYVPVRYRSGWSAQQSTFYTQNRTTIVHLSSTATWKGSNGKTVSGAKVNTAKMKFSTGSGSTGKVGGGSLRAGTSGGGSSGGSGSGSSGSKSSSTVKSKTGSGSGGGSLRGRK